MLFKLFLGDLNVLSLACGVTTAHDTVAKQELTIEAEPALGAIDHSHVIDKENVIVGEATTSGEDFKLAVLANVTEVIDLNLFDFVGGRVDFECFIHNTNKVAPDRIGRK